MSFSPLITFLGVAPIAFAAGMSMVDKRVKMLLARNPAMVESPMLAELVLRLQNPPTKPWEEAVSTYRVIAEKEMTRSAFFQLQLSLLLVERGTNPLMARQYLRKANAMDLILDERFFSFHSNYLEGKRSGFEDNSMSFEEVEFHRNESEKAIVDAMSEISKSLQLMRTKSCDQHKLLEEGIRLSRATKRANTHLEELLRLTKSSPDALRLYAFFLEFVMNDESTAKQVATQANEIEEETLNNDMEYHSQATVTIHGSEDNLGIVIDLTSEMCHLFGYSRDELVGQNISTLTPPPFDAMHDLFLLRYLETNTEFVSVQRAVWGQHANGHIMALDLKLNPFVNGEGELIFVGNFQKRSFTKRFVMLDLDQNVQFASKAAWKEVLKAAPVTVSTPLSSFVAQEQMPPSQEEWERLFREAGTARCTLAGESREIRSSKFSWSIDVRGKHWNADLVLLEIDPNDKTDEVSATVTSQHDGHRLDISAAQGVQESGPTSPGSVSGTVNGNGNFSVVLPERVGTARSFDIGSIAESEYSSSVRSTSSGSRKAPNSVYKIVERRLRADRSRIRTYQRLCLMSVCLCAVLSAVQWFNRSRLYAQGVEAIGLVQSSMERTFHLIDSSVVLQEILMSIDQNATEEELNVLRERLDRDIEETLESHILVSASDLNSDDALRALNNNQGIEVVGDRTAELEDPSRREQYSLWVSVHLVIGNLRDMLSENEFDPVCDHRCKFVVNNAPVALADSCMEASTLYKDAAIRVMKQVELFDVTSLVVVSVLSMLAIVLLIVPSVLTEWSRLKMVSDAMMRVPPHTVRLLGEQARKNAQKLQSFLHHEEEDYDSDDGDEAADGMEGGNALHGSAKVRSFRLRVKKPGENNVAKSLAEAPKTSENFSPTKVGPKIKSKAMQRTKQPKEDKAGLWSRFKQLLRALLKATFVLGWPYVVTVIYFGINTMMERGLLEKRISTGEKVFLAGQRWVAAHNLYLFTHKQQFRNSTWYIWHDGEEEHLNATTWLLDSLIETHEGLVYGNEEIQIPAMRDSLDHPEQYALLFEDACDSTCAEDAALSQAQDLQNGLHFAIEEFIVNDSKLMRLAHEAGAVPFDDELPHAERLQVLLEKSLLAVALEKSMNLYADDFRELIESQLFTGRLILIFFLCALVLSAYATFQLFKRQHEEIQNIQYLLLIFPLKVLRHVPELRRLNPDWKR